MPGEADATLRNTRTPLVPWWVVCLPALMSGWLMSAAFNLPFGHWLAWIAPIPFLCILPRASAGQAWISGGLLALVFYRLGAGWIISIGGWLGASFLLIYAVWMGLSFRVTKLVMKQYGPTALCWAWPVAFVGQEIIRCEWPARYRFAYLAWGYTQPGEGWIGRVAGLGGVYLVSLMLASFAAVVAYGLVRRRLTSFIPAAAVGAVILVLPMLMPTVQANVDRRLSVACVQSEGRSYLDLINLTRQAVIDPAHPKFIVLPEHAICDLASERHPAIRLLAKIAVEHGVYICVGAHVAAPRGLECDYDNVGLLIGPDGSLIHQQAKAVPVPCFRDGNPAQHFAVASTPDANIGVYICYDGDFTDIPRHYADLGAELFLVPVMNPAHWPPEQRRQQARMAIYRAIETGRPAIRSASSGVSQIIDCDGREVGRRSQLDGEGYLCGAVSPASVRTGFVHGGFLIAPAIGWIYLLAIALLTFRLTAASIVRRTVAIFGRFRPVRSGFPAKTSQPSVVPRK